ncbi:MAG: cytochrome c oxidase assembly protein [Solirubrobacteraceae bacterium]
MLTAVEVALAAGVGASYLLRLRTLRGTGAMPARWRMLCFAAGIGVEVAAVIALEGLARRLIYVTTVERVAIGDLAPLLLVLGVSASVLEPLARVLEPLASVRRAHRLRAFTPPSLALALWIANTAVWHLPGPCEAALGSAALMLAQHLLFAIAGVCVWLVLIGPAADVHWRRRPGRWVAYALSWRALPVALGVGGIVSPIPFYEHYVATDLAFTLSTLSDQAIAGCVLIGESALVAIGLLLHMYVKLGGGDGQAPPSSRQPGEADVLAAS